MTPCSEMRADRDVWRFNARHLLAWQQAFRLRIEADYWERRAEINQLLTENERLRGLLKEVARSHRAMSSVGSFTGLHARIDAALSETGD